MTKSEQIKILNDKIKANNAQYDINRLNQMQTRCTRTSKIYMFSLR